MQTRAGSSTVNMQFLLLLVVTGVIYVGGMTTDSTPSSTSISFPLAESSESPETARAAIAQANNAFAIELFKTLNNESGNMIMSPLSASAALAVMWMGSGGATAQQLAAALHLPEDRQRTLAGYRAMLDTLKSSEGVEVNIAKKMFIQQNFQIKEDFRTLAVEHFSSDAQNVNFQTENEAARQTINEWAQQATNGKIKDLFPQGQLSTDAVLVLVNAIYFKGEWMKAFMENMTANEPFHFPGGSQVNVAMMNGVIQTGFARNRELQCNIVELPYKGNSLRMLVILPDEVEGLPQLEKSLSKISLHNLRLFPIEVDVKLPKFKIETKLDLKTNLQKLQVTDLFNERANLTGLSDATNIVVSKVLQKAFIEVNERGTVAAVATAVETLTRSGRISRDFHANRPFLFVIQGADGSIIFMGRVTHPKTN